MVVLKENCCRFCTKVFCCSDCRVNHETSKHPKPKCELCVKQPLPYKSDLRESSDLFCHVVFSHLPLRCVLCGDKYKSYRDLENAGQACRWWKEKRSREQNRAKNNEEDRVEGIKLPLTPYSLQSTEANKSLRSIDINISSITRLKQENFNSPPELARHTSTPVHSTAALPGQKHQNQFYLKTPSSLDKRSTFENTAGTTGSSCFESRYYTGISQLSSSNNNTNTTTNNNNINDRAVDPTWNSPSCSILKQHLSCVEVSKDFSMTKPDGMDSIEKRVRFSDQCLASTNCDNSAYFAENDIFFEARESLDEDADSNNNNNDDGIAASEAKKYDSVDAKPRAQDTKAYFRSQQSSDGVEKKLADSCSLESGSAVDKPNSSSSSSRLVMMLVVEKTDSQSLSSLDLGPLIDSGLKKLEESCGTSKLNVEVSAREAVASTSSSDKVEQQKSESVQDNSSANVSSSSGALMSDGIFSMVAKVVRTALKKLPAVGSAAASSSRNLSREPLPQSACPALLSSVTSTSSLSIASAELVATDATSSSSASVSQITLQRSSSKRSRDQALASSARGDLAVAGNTGSPRSPAAKRHRGWYRIRGREPIARMRQLVPQSPRGTSLETQRFQQGSLTVGDTFLPLPSRAHQSTQTED